MLLKTLSKYDDEEAAIAQQMKEAEDKMIKESYERQKEKLKFRRINEDEPYEDGDNFDAHVGVLKSISNPYDLLEQIEKGLSLGDSDSDSDQLSSEDEAS